MKSCPKPEIGLRLAELVVSVSRKMIIMGATASRDWQSQHHDPDKAREAGLPDIIMNNYTQAGLISRYVTDWCGTLGRIGRMRFSMRKPVLPGNALVLRGIVVDIVKDESSTDFHWVELEVEMRVEGAIVTSATVKLALPTDSERASTWHCLPSEWHP